MFKTRKAGLILALGVAGALAGPGVASANLRAFPTLAHELQMKQAAAAAGVTFPQPPCPENGVVNGVVGSTGVPGVGVGNCGVVQPVATSLPWPGQMAYAGGHVQVHPHEYLVFWGWGAKGAFPSATCQPVKVTEPLRDGTTQTFTLGCDPNGAGKLMADFVAGMGGTQWAGSQTQYYETDPKTGAQSFVQNDKNVLAGVWLDDGDPSTGDNPNLKITKSSNPTGLTNTNTALAAEATRAAAHFGVPDDQLIDSNFIIVQPAGFSDPNAESLGYCAFHDYTESDASGNAYYQDPHVKQGILGKSVGVAYTNMPYVLNQGANCGADLVNPSSDGGNLDGFTLALGHEIEETVTDPGAEATVGNASDLSSSNASGGGATFLGGWYDATDPNENGDKCAYVGQLTNGFTPTTLPGSTGDIVGNNNERFAVQALWSNSAAQGAGYCAGVASTDLPDAVGSGEQSGSQGGTDYQPNAQTVHPGVMPPPTWNTDHLFTDSSSDANSMLSPDPSSPSTSGSQQDSLDITQGDLSYAGGVLMATMTIKDLAAQASAPVKVNRYIVSWNQGAAGYGAQVSIDGTGAVSASDGTAANNYGDNVLPASAVTVTPGKNGTIVIRIPAADVGKPTSGTLLSVVSMETIEAAGNPAVGDLGYVVDQDQASQDYLVGGPLCSAAGGSKGSKGGSGNGGSGNGGSGSGGSGSGGSGSGGSGNGGSGNGGSGNGGSGGSGSTGSGSAGGGSAGGSTAGSNGTTSGSSTSAGSAGSKRAGNTAKSPKPKAKRHRRAHRTHHKASRKARHHTARRRARHGR